MNLFQNLKEKITESRFEELTLGFEFIYVFIFLVIYIFTSF